jgi:hypothetical protein
MPSAHVREDVPKLVRDAFANHVCSFEWSDYYTKLSVQLLTVEGKVLLTTEPMPIEILRNHSILAGRLADWKRRIGNRR